MDRSSAASIHCEELHKSFVCWQRKPLIREIYRDFYLRIRSLLFCDQHGCTVELGAGFAGLKSVFPGCIATDLFPTPWVDQSENVYRLSFADATVSNLVMMDVFHHLEFPGDALTEFIRVLKPNGRLILLEPDVGMLGFAVYGLFHHEPLGLRQKIQWNGSKGDLDRPQYYAAQSNAFRIFHRGEFQTHLQEWDVVCIQRLAALSYIMAGGLRKRQLYPTAAYGWLKWIDRVLDRFPYLFATRMFVVLQKKEGY
jgi:SAM-dependent methyltransferase